MLTMKKRACGEFSLVNVEEVDICVLIPRKFEDDISQFKYEMMTIRSYKPTLVRFIQDSYSKCHCGQRELLLSDKLCTERGIDDKVRLYFLLRLYNIYNTIPNDSNYVACKVHNGALFDRAKRLMRTLYGIDITETFITDLAPFLMDWIHLWVLSRTGNNDGNWGSHHFLTFFFVWI